MKLLGFLLLMPLLSWGLDPQCPTTPFWESELDPHIPLPETFSVPEIRIVSSAKQLYLPHVYLWHQNQTYGYYSSYRNPWAFLLLGWIPHLGSVVSPDPVGRDPHGYELCRWSWENPPTNLTQVLNSRENPEYSTWYQLVFSNCYHWIRWVLRREQTKATLQLTPHQSLSWKLWDWPRVSFCWTMGRLL